MKVIHGIEIFESKTEVSKKSFREHLLKSLALVALMALVGFLLSTTIYFYAPLSVGGLIVITAGLIPFLKNKGYEEIDDEGINYLGRLKRGSKAMVSDIVSEINEQGRVISVIEYKKIVDALNKKERQALLKGIGMPD